MATGTKTELEIYLDLWDKEVETTTRLLRNLPAGREDWKPADSARNLRELAWIFVVQEHIAEALAKGELGRSAPPETPQVTVAELVAQFEAAHRAAREAWRNAAPGRFDQQVTMPVGPKKMGQMRVGDAVWMFLLDDIHHRGQMSVCMRMLGAKVTPIYGPSGDEPWS